MKKNPVKSNPNENFWKFLNLDFWTSQNPGHVRIENLELAKMTIPKICNFFVSTHFSDFRFLTIFRIWMADLQAGPEIVPDELDPPEKWVIFYLVFCKSNFLLDTDSENIQKIAFLKILIFLMMIFFMNQKMWISIFQKIFFRQQFLKIFFMRIFSIDKNHGSDFQFSKNKRCGEFFSL